MRMGLAKGEIELLRVGHMREKDVDQIGERGRNPGAGLLSRSP